MIMFWYLNNTYSLLYHLCLICSRLNTKNIKKKKIGIVQTLYIKDGHRQWCHQLVCEVSLWRWILFNPKWDDHLEIQHHFVIANLWTNNWNNKSTFLFFLFYWAHTFGIQGHLRHHRNPFGNQGSRHLLAYRENAGFMALLFRNKTRGEATSIFYIQAMGCLTLWLSKLIFVTSCDLGGNHDDNESADQTSPP